MLNVDKKIEELLKKYPNARPDGSRAEFYACLARSDIPPTFGIVVDNRDPQCLGRLRVELPLVAPGKVSPWYQVRNLWAEKEAGLWAIPDIGTQVLVSFPYNNMSRGVILGCVYDEKHRPPEPSTENYADSTLWQTKNHRLEFIDVKGGKKSA